MKYIVNADGQVEFSFGSTRYPFEVVFDSPALRHFMELAGDALVHEARSIIRGEADAGQIEEQP